METNKIICGDCLEVMREIPDKSIDLVLTDPPYGIKHDKGRGGLSDFGGCGRLIERRRYDMPACISVTGSASNDAAYTITSIADDTIEVEEALTDE